MSVPPASKSASASKALAQAAASRSSWLCAGVLLLAGIAVYANSFTVPFVFDDLASIGANPSIRSWQTALFPPLDLTVSGRPLVNLTLALNHALGGTDVRGYHALNLALHVGVALLLYGLVLRTAHIRETKRKDDAPEACGDSSAHRRLALAVALLWLVHPLQTAAVTYTVQRAEVLVSLFYLLTLYTFVRSIHAAAPWRWLVASVLSCAAGMASKEVMISAPIIVLLYDRTFVAGSLGAAWRSRGRYYLALAATWLLLAWLMMGTNGRSGTAGFGLGVSSWTYLLTEGKVLLHYLRLVLWPDPLVFDYGPSVLVRNAASALPHALVCALLFGGAIYFTVWRRSAIGFLGLCFFAILVPTSSVVPLADPMVEHRMYLPLAAVVIPAVFGAHALLSRRQKWAAPVLVAATAVLATVSIQRNLVYRSIERLWRDTVEKRPENPRAWAALGRALLDGSRTAEGAGCLRRSVELAPGHAGVRHLLANAEVQLGRIPEAIEQFEAAIRLDSENARLHNDAGNAWLQLGRIDRAVSEFTTATRLDPSLPEAHYNLGNALRLAGRPEEAMAEHRAALQLAPAFLEPRFNLASSLAALGRFEEAAAEFRAITRLRPDFAAGWTSLGHMLARLGRNSEAREAYSAALHLVPGESGAEEGLRRLEGGVAR